MLEIFIMVIFALATFAVLIGLLLYLFQHRLLYHPQHIPNSFRLEYRSPHTEGFLELSNGDKIHYYHFPPPVAVDSQTPVLVYFHGNAGDLTLWTNIASELVIKIRCALLIIDYPGFGKSCHHFARSHKQLIETALKTYDLAEQLYPTNRKFIYGKSFGSGVAGELATALLKHPEQAKNLAGLIWETPYQSLPIIAHQRHPWAPGFLMRNRLSNLGIDSQRFPILIFHGVHDEVVPYSHGLALSQHYPQAKLIRFPEGDHSNLNLFSEYWGSLTEFINGPPARNLS